MSEKILLQNLSQTDFRIKIIVPESLVFPAVDDDVDRGVGHEEDVGDVTDYGTPIFHAPKVTIKKP